jgi:2-polyprenyl-6-methoxyphenol hydroxylase-like FAD-dependent oxidoreductase
MSSVVVCDVLVVGAGVAGARVARLLEESGLRVLVVDRAHPGRPSVSSSFVWPSGVRALQRSGVLAALLMDHPRLMSWAEHWGDQERRSDPPWPAPGFCLNPDRPHLDELLRRRCSEGVSWRWSSRVVSVSRGGAGRRWDVVIETRPQREAARVSCDWIVGADGRRSSVAEQLGIRHSVETQAYRRWTVAKIERWGGSEGTVHSGFVGSDWVGVSPTRFGGAIASLSRPLDGAPGPELRDLVSAIPWIEDHCESTSIQPIGRTTRAGNHLASEPVGPGWLLVGDAALSCEPIAATGISLALLGAEVAVGVIQQGVDRYSAWLRHTADQLLPGLSTAPTSAPTRPVDDAGERWRRRITYLEDLLGAERTEED